MNEAQKTDRRFSVFPNPSNGFVNISTTKNKFSIEIFEQCQFVPFSAATASPENRKLPAIKFYSQGSSPAADKLSVIENYLKSESLFSLTSTHSISPTHYRQCVCSAPD